MFHPLLAMILPSCNIWYARYLNVITWRGIVLKGREGEVSIWADGTDLIQLTRAHEGILLSTSPLSPSLSLHAPATVTALPMWLQPATRQNFLRVNWQAERRGEGGSVCRGRREGEGRGEGACDPDVEREEGWTVCKFITTLITTILAEHTSFARDHNKKKQSRSPKKIIPYPSILVLISSMLKQLWLFQRYQPVTHMWSRTEE